MGKGWANRKRIARRTRRNYRGNEKILERAGDRKPKHKKKVKPVVETTETK